MSDSNHRPEPDYLEQATGALRAAPVPVGPPAEVAAATVAAIHGRLAGRMPAEPARPRLTRRTVMRYLGYGSAATAAAALLALWLVGGKAVAFDDALAKVQKAEAVKYDVREAEDGTERNTSSVVVAGNKIRVEGTNFPLTFVVDHDLKGAIILDGRTKKYQTIDLATAGVGVPVDAFGVNFRTQVLNLKAPDAKPTGTETVNGAVLDKYTVQGAAALGVRTADWTFWLDRKSQFPVKVTCEYTIQLRGVKMDGTRFEADKTISRFFENFEWNPKVEKGVFGLDPPEGYVEGEIFRTIPPYKKK
jgi:hypothetical protein